mgnify:CR=1 FL=1
MGEGWASGSEEPMARRGEGEYESFPLPFTLLDKVLYSALLSEKRSI